jgi:hypothetical protein
MNTMTARVTSPSIATRVAFGNPLPQKQETAGGGVSQRNHQSVGLVHLRIVPPLDAGQLKWPCLGEGNVIERRFYGHHRVEGGRNVSIRIQ